MNKNTIKNWFFIFLTIYFIIQFLVPLKYTFDPDEGTHALIGLFYKDVLYNLKNFHSIDDILRFAVDYVVKYPKISAHYPPLYHILLALTFFISESLVLARILNIILTVISSIIVYKLCCKLLPDKNLGLFSAIFFLSFFMIFYLASKTLMDILQILTFSLTLLYYLGMRNRKNISLKEIIILAILLSLSFLTKFFSAFLPIIIIIDSLIHNRKLIKYLILSIVLAVIFISPYLFFYLKFRLYKITLSVATTQHYEYYYWDYFNFLYIFGPFLGLYVLVSIVWLILKNYKNPLIMGWFFIPLITFAFFKDVDVRFLFILMPIYALACGSFIYTMKNKFRSKRKFSLLIVLIFALLASQFGYNIYIRQKDPYYPVEDLIKEIDEDGNILIMQDEPVYSSVFILYGRLNNVEGNSMRPCILQENNLSKDFLKEWGFRYIIDQNEEIDKESMIDLNLNLKKEIQSNDVSIRLFELEGSLNKVDCAYVCRLKGKLCKGQSFSNVTSLIQNI